MGCSPSNSTLQTGSPGRPPLARHDTDLDLLREAAQRAEQDSAVEIISRRLSCEDFLDYIGLIPIELLPPVLRPIASSFITENHKNMMESSSELVLDGTSLKDLIALPPLPPNMSIEMEEQIQMDAIKMLSIAFRREKLKIKLSTSTMPWTFYRNIGAFDSTTLSLMAQIFVTLSNALPSAHSSGILPRLKDETITSLDEENKDPPSSSSFISDESSETSLLRLNNFLLSSDITNLTLPDYYNLTSNNLYDFDLPPGPVTMSDTKVIISALRQGGCLTTRSIHKLIRLAYRRMTTLPTVTKVNIQPGEKLTIVGDLHGQLSDLLLILDSSGLPNEHHKYIFNGDFVDRGEWSVEVMCILLCLYISTPDGCVTLNRGNHEDEAVCGLYGFREECLEKYNSIIFGMFLELFRVLPLCTVVNSSVFVVHGGLFRNENVSIKQLENLPRQMFTLDCEELNNPCFVDDESQRLAHEGLHIDNENESAHDENDGMSTADRVAALELIQDALWSDPHDLPGVNMSLRGAGIAFGSDITTQFLTSNGLSFLVRSHECVPGGYEERYSSERGQYGVRIANLATIFSASNYSGGTNAGAYLEFFNGRPTDLQVEQSESGLPPSVNFGVLSSDRTSPLKTVHGTDLTFLVRFYYAEPLRLTVAGDRASSDSNKDRGLAKSRNGTEYDLAAVNLPGVGNPASSLETLSQHPATTAASATGSLAGRNITMIPHKSFHRSDVVLGSSAVLGQILFNRKNQILEVCQRLDKTRSSGLLTVPQWQGVLTDVLAISLSWDALFPYLVQTDSIKIDSSGRTMVIYARFVSRIEDLQEPLLRAATSTDGTNSKLKSFTSVSDVSSEVSSGRKRFSGKDTLENASVVAATTVGHKKATKGKVPDFKPASCGGPSYNDPHQFSRYLVAREVIQALYGHHSILWALWAAIDRDGDGLINADDFHAFCITTGITPSFEGLLGCTFIEEADSTENNGIPKSADIDAREVFSTLLDVFAVGVVDFNLFAELFRLSVLAGPEGANGPSAMAFSGNGLEVHEAISSSFAVGSAQESQLPSPTHQDPVGLFLED